MPSKQPVRLLSSDLDGTLVGNPESTARFKGIWEGIPREQRPVLCYNTGRLIEDTLALIESDDLPRPDYVLGGVGTLIWDATRNGPVPGFVERFAPGWDLERIEQILAQEFPAVQRQAPEFLHPYKSSWYLENARREAIAAIETRLKQAGLDVEVIYSRQHFLDVLPRHASKGRALAWLAQHLDIPPDAIVVAGDSGNDSSMFLLPGVRGILVENAGPELFEAVIGRETYAANGILADGLLDGLKHYGVIGAMPARSSLRSRPSVDVPAMFRPRDLRELSTDDVALVREGFEHAVDVLHRNVTPLGFSAASLDDNWSTGVDHNYRSVWARDGAITVIQSLFIDDPEIRAAQRQTVVTLLDHISPAGQIPSSVHLDSGQPDYSGVGGIASIDGGLWVLIAFYNYVQKTGEIELLEKYAPTLQRAMNWLTAQDTNNDGLLEIPEAGDWTDLFGHSYNVLYDETLWYRANVCHARLLELRGDNLQAAEYLQRSQHIRGEILRRFWPRTQFDASRATPNFAERQHSLGDARYLLAQISPFGFSWRCDVWGNILAFLFNILDVARARTTFDFMWGVGVSDPFPVRNLYPPVMAGDPEWRPYFVVNLLNLPGHYHNGGIWPHIGGMWVRFIHRLGLRNVACRELVKLAQLNRSGLRSEWEFNEWAHSGTGRPMGKRYQAWAAASYLRACHELELDVDDRGHD